MRKFIIAVSNALLLMGCAEISVPCTPTMEIPDYTDDNGRFHKGKTIEGPKDSGRKYLGKDTCEEYPHITTWDSLRSTAWGQNYIEDWEDEQWEIEYNKLLMAEQKQADDWIESRTDHFGYNLIVTNDEISEETILRQYEAEPSEHPNSGIYTPPSFGENKKGEPIYSLVRGPSLRSEDPDCQQEMKSNEVFDQVSSKLEVIRGSENLTIDEIRKMRDRIMFQGDNWYWPDSNSACLKAKTDMTFRTQYRSSERPSNFGKNNTCPGNEMFDKIGDSAAEPSVPGEGIFLKNRSKLNSTENYNVPRILPTADDPGLNLEHYPAELQVCKDKCFTDIILTKTEANLCTHNGDGSCTDVIEGHPKPKSKLNGAKKIYCSKHGIPQGMPVSLTGQYASTGGVDPGSVLYKFRDDGECNYWTSEHYGGWEIIRRPVSKKVNIKVPYYAKLTQFGYEVDRNNDGPGMVHVHAPKIQLLGTEEQRIACTKCETEQYAQMCRFPKNEIFIVRKK